MHCNYICIFSFSSILSYTPHAPQEFGSVECFGKNDVGLQQKSCKFQIIPSGPPNFPFHCSVLNQSYDSLFIQCSLDVDEQTVNSSNNSSWNSNHLFPVKWQDNPRILIHPKTHYVCEAYHLTSSALVANVSAVIANQSLYPTKNASWLQRSQSNSVVSFVVPNLPSETTLRLRIFASNTRGKSDSIWIRSMTTRPPEKLIERNQDQVSGNGVLWSLNDESEGQPSSPDGGSSSIASQSSSSSGFFLTRFISRFAQYLNGQIFASSPPSSLIPMSLVSLVLISSIVSLFVLIFIRVKRKRVSNLTCSSRNSSASNVNANVVLTSDSPQLHHQQYSSLYKGSSSLGVMAPSSSSYFLKPNSENNATTAVTSAGLSHQQQMIDKCSCCPADASCFEMTGSDISSSNGSHRNQTNHRLRSNEYQTVHPYHHHHHPQQQSYPPDIFPSSTYASLRRDPRGGILGPSVNDPTSAKVMSLVGPNNSMGNPLTATMTNNSNGNNNCETTIHSFPSTLTDKTFVQSFGEFVILF